MRGLSLKAVLILSAAIQIGCSSGVTVSSSAYTTSGTTTTAVRHLFATINPTTAVSEFKFCVARIKLLDESGKAVLTGSDGTTATSDDTSESSEITFAPGLIDVSKGVAVDWGSVTLPTGFKLAGVRIKVKKDKDLCGVDYSLSFNGQTSPQDIEFKFKVSPAADISGATSKVELALGEVVADLRTAADSGAISSLKSRIEGKEGTATAQ